MNPSPPVRYAAVALALCVIARGAQADNRVESERRAELRERLGSRIDGDLTFRDHAGARVTLKQYFDRGTPVVLTLNYFHCPMLCDVQLDRLGRDLQTLARDPQLRFRALTVSIDPRDRSQDAREKRAQLAREAGARFDWTFLTGEAGQVLKLAEALGASFAYDARTRQYDHVPATFVLTPDGTIARYLYGLDIGPRDLRLALIEAAAGRTGTSADKILLRCFQYDPASGTYSLYVLGAVRTSSTLVLLGIALALVRAWRRDARGAAS